MNLTAVQQAALDRVVAAHQARLRARQDAEVEARALIETRVGASARLESQAVREAIEAGVPKTRVGREGLDSKDYGTVARILALTDADAAAGALIETARAALHRVQVRRATPDEVSVWKRYLHGSGDVLLRVDWDGFEPTADSVLAERTGGATVHLEGWAHRFAPGDDLDWESLEGGQHFAAAVQYDDRLIEAMRSTASA